MAEKAKKKKRSLKKGNRELDISPIPDRSDFTAEAFSDEPIDENDVETVYRKQFLKEYKSFEMKTQRKSSKNQSNEETEKLNWKQRVRYSFALMGLFALILSMGHFYCDLFVLTIAGLIYHEIASLKRLESEFMHLPLFFSLRWFAFWVTLAAVAPGWFVSVFELFLPLLPAGNRFLPFILAHWQPLVYSLQMIGFATFILSLRRYSLKYQFKQLGIMILTCLFVVGQFPFFVRTIHTGLAWFFLSTGAVICNDSFAYITGKLFGRTKLSSLSPNKTVEGFFGGMIVTLLWNTLVVKIMSFIPRSACPEPIMTLVPFSFWFQSSDCGAALYTPNEVLIVGKKLFIAPMYIHSFALSLMASLFAPLGGLFASAFKRSIGVKDFGSVIPGHGGLTDRFDCQLVMGVLTSLYVHCFVSARPLLPSLDLILSTIRELSPQEKAQIINQLTTEL
eukprot:GHVP01048949.1.p1 GENE.GHVP01048949.1~~GHVP01048949.1.p1  ORF type:complete len:449 (+),score=60.14 GHVP01048949.1:20-1366(+)